MKSVVGRWAPSAQAFTCGAKPVRCNARFGSTRVRNSRAAPPVDRGVINLDCAQAPCEWPPDLHLSASMGSANPGPVIRRTTDPSAPLANGVPSAVHAHSATSMSTLGWPFHRQRSWIATRRHKECAREYCRLRHPLSAQTIWCSAASIRPSVAREDDGLQHHVSRSPSGCPPRRKESSPTRMSRG